MPDNSKELGRRIGSYLAIALIGIMVFFLVLCLQGFETGRSSFIASQTRFAQSRAVMQNAEFVAATGYVKYLYALCWIEGACLVPLLYLRYCRAREKRTG